MPGELSPTTLSEKPIRKVWIDVLFVLIILFVCALATLPQLKVGDFPSHLAWAKELNDNAVVLRPNLLFQQLVVAVKAFTPFVLIEQAFPRLLEYYYLWYYNLPAMIVMLAVYLATCILLRQRFEQVMPSSSTYAQLYAWLLSFACIFLDPILLFTLNERLILGYIPANVWHNPTYSLLRPFAIWIFFFVYDHWGARVSARNWLVLALVTALANLAKPNFILSFLPAIGLLALLRNRRIRDWNWGLLTALIIPSGLVLAFQYLIQYAAVAENQICLIPFKAALLNTGNLARMALFIGLSIALPLLFTVFSWRRVKTNLLWLIAWLNFVIALLTFLLFVELPHMSSLDLLWGPMLGAFFLFVVTILDALQNRPDMPSKWQAFTLWLLFGMHLVSGFVYTLITIFHPGPVF